MKGILIDVLIGFSTNLFTNWVWDRIKGPNGASISEGFLPKAIRWMVVTGWGMVPLGFIIVALYLLENRWPLSMTWAIVLLAGGFLANLLLLVIGVKISLKRGVWWSVGLMLILIAIQAGTLYLLDRGLPNYIAIDCPGQVGAVTSIGGRVIDPKWRVYVVIKPRSVDGSFVTTPSYPGKDGVWYAKCDFGGVVGEKYEVFAVALPPGVNTPDFPTPIWLVTNAPYKTSVYVSTRH